MDQRERGHLLSTFLIIGNSTARGGAGSPADSFIKGLLWPPSGSSANRRPILLVRAINTAVMQDEARHVMFGPLALDECYPQLTQPERDEREGFCVDACCRMRDRFLGDKVWSTLGLPQEVTDYVNKSDVLRQVRGSLFLRIVPIPRDIALWSDEVRKAKEVVASARACATPPGHGGLDGLMSVGGPTRTRNPWVWIAVAPVAVAVVIIVLTVGDEVGVDN